MLLNNDINKILGSGESINWQGKVNRAPLFAVAVIIIVISLAISFWLFNQPQFSYTFNSVPKQTSGKTAGSIVAAIGLLITVFYLWHHLVKKFFVTNKRVLIKSGMIGTDFTSIYFNEVKRVEVEVNLIGKIFSVGTVKIDIGKTETRSTSGGRDNSPQVRTKTMYDFLYYIDKPYEVYRQLQTSLTDRVESLYSGRADKENLPEGRSIT